MKRLAYISKFTKGLTLEDLQNIGDSAVAHNKEDDISGVLFCFRDIFYQILEGENNRVDTCFARICKDPRHTDVYCLKSEEGDFKKRHVNWEMRPIVLQGKEDKFVVAIRSLMDSMVQNSNILKQYVPDKILEDLKNGKSPDTDESVTSNKIIMFLDIFESSYLTATLSTKEIKELLDHFYAFASEMASAARGKIDKLLGDGMFIYFEHMEVDLIFEKVLKMLDALENYRSEAKNNVTQYLHIGIGMSTGEVIQCNLGSDFRRDYTIIGEAVNTAAKVEKVTRKVNNHFLFDESISSLVSDPSAIEKVGTYRQLGGLPDLSLFSLSDPRAKRDFTIESYQQTLQRALASR